MIKDIIRQCTDEIIMYSKLMYDRGLISASGGNISVRCGSDYFLITASGAAFRNLGRDDILLCRQDGSILEGGEDKVLSKEYCMHLNCYAARPMADCVLHLHPSCSIAFTAYDQELPLYTASAKLKLGCVPMIPYAEPGSKDLAEKARISILKNPSSKIFLMKAHGILILEQSVKAGFELAELTEDTAKIALLAGDRLIMRRRCLKGDGF
ncbi:class II aldolase/adducin family protein [Enterocloster citroniae]|jgi:ribulose-5-phosphate 4-epimerase/fuculose-1-phosphate aldolase|uniref:class II aldolase/adducin family protein n=1 Tax=Enterocloster citroniae TaxID=358743 RepID=UPI00349EB4C2